MDQVSTAANGAGSQSSEWERMNTAVTWALSECRKGARQQEASHRHTAPGTTMASPPAAAKPKAIYAHVDFVKFGEGVSKHYGFTRQLLTAATLGIGLGMVWKTWHWNEKRVVAQYYADLAKKEAKEQAERQATIKAKFAELEKELLG